ncbi:NAD(P)H-binding protein [Altererythrobacter sp. MTPC7]|uniref:NAD(P)H-binding protein n=1 Tax=Altererythrobacter sp. MTPC7 TaxID=3056567 RepID=UPI0036F3FCEB
MSDHDPAAPTRIVLVGATGLVGRAVMEACVGREDVRLVAISRREAPMPDGARMEMFVADPAEWGDVLKKVRAEVLVSALGTTIRKVGGDKDEFYAVDHDLVLQTARAAHDTGLERMVSVSSVGADAFSDNFYLKTKGETEKALAKVGFRRLDILRPGLLRGTRKADLRPLEGLGRIASPVADLVLRRKYEKYRSIHASTMAHAVLALAKRRTQGKFVHEHEGLQRAAKMLPELGGDE